MKDRTEKEILLQYKEEGVTERDICKCHKCNRRYVWQELNVYTGHNVVEEHCCDACGGLFCEDCYDHKEHEGCMYYCKECSKIYGDK